MPMIYNVCEVFYSLQGEGLLQGLPMIFIRLAGCNLMCEFCDTKYARDKGEKKDLREIIKETEKYPAKWVCITGGEPFLQKLSPLLDALKKREYNVSVETNGTIWQDIKPDWLTVSPKREGLLYFKYGYDERFLKIANEFKYVITERKDLKLIDRRIKAPIVLQPVDNNIEIAKYIVNILKKHPKENWYLRMQIHKLIDIK
ncbi:MAG: 7-carboxy-7-deazaguanine synthase QueE [Candidatus Omnitrophica bacterium]|nr:7-carboxy-7-deazaguanine synthase QueE [Candidatus Omnitrophota bacterium]MCM8777609.1 7-carboxy-7-deazaguanine synthase QueE [Candidatus Omnitrophota bacterium]